MVTLVACFSTQIKLTFCRWNMVPNLLQPAEHKTPHSIVFCFNFYQDL